MTTSSQPTYRMATAADIPAIVALVESAYRGESGRRGWTTESDLLDGQRTDAAGVADALSRPGSCILLLEHDGQPLASCQLERKGEAAYFGMFAVDPARQAGGLGKRLLGEAERLAREDWGCRLMEMTVIVQREELIAWYERRGYRRTGQFAPFPYGDERFGIPRRGDLRFEVLVKRLAGEAA
ncbi:MAG TPA: GNAT family N-acetyltransferase [Frateuria sp.]|uniref:GNAT family N-acetyltransferase n=1 Tax=Frateuria sp. TaxID=2211372 RepID=UPI002D810772|nr:GNAT family N-acetyltransferase [Frateuria sp.]HET6805446.1 GNAT family N-acetyltransferase [Frateuria sp.]